jgi:hypoxanthine phosphoribosyltransferase
MAALQAAMRRAAEKATAPAAPARRLPALPPALRRHRRAAAAAAAGAAASGQPAAATSTTTALRPPPEVKAVLYTEAQIAEAVARMGREITRDFALDAGAPGDGGCGEEEEELVVCGVLTGAFVFTADLARAIAPSARVRVDFLRASSYGSASESSGDVRVSGMGGDRDEARWRGKRVVLVEDVIDSGHTLRRLADELARLGAREVRVAALLDKRARRKVQAMKADYVGFDDVPDEFVVGYGLDYDERWRTLPYIAALKEEVYTPAASSGSSSTDE